MKIKEGLSYQLQEKRYRMYRRVWQILLNQFGPADSFSRLFILKE